MVKLESDQESWMKTKVIKMLKERTLKWLKFNHTKFKLCVVHYIPTPKPPEWSNIYCSSPVKQSWLLNCQLNQLLMSECDLTA